MNVSFSFPLKAVFQWQEYRFSFDVIPILVLEKAKKMIKFIRS